MDDTVRRMPEPSAGREGRCGLEVDGRPQARLAREDPEEETFQEISMQRTGKPGNEPGN